MAKQVITRLVDDLDGGEADETVRYTFDGIAYEIDLSGKNAAQLRKMLDPYLSASTRVGRVGAGAQLIPTRPTKVGGSTFGTNREMNAQIREWATRKGHKLADRGRIPQHIVDEYHAVGGKLPDVTVVQEALADRVHTPKKTAPKKAPAAAFKPPSARKAS